MKLKNFFVSTRFETVARRGKKWQTETKKKVEILASGFTFIRQFIMLFHCNLASEFDELYLLSEAHSTWTGTNETEEKI